MATATEWTYGGRIDWTSVESLMDTPKFILLDCLRSAIKERAELLYSRSDWETLKGYSAEEVSFIWDDYAILGQPDEEQKNSPYKRRPGQIIASFFFEIISNRFYNSNKGINNGSTISEKRADNWTTVTALNYLGYDGWDAQERIYRFRYPPNALYETSIGTQGKEYWVRKWAKDLYTMINLLQDRVFASGNTGYASSEIDQNNISTDFRYTDIFRADDSDSARSALWNATSWTPSTASLELRTYSLGQYEDPRDYGINSQAGHMYRIRSEKEWSFYPIDIAGKTIDAEIYMYVSQNPSGISSDRSFYPEVDLLTDEDYYKTIYQYNGIYNGYTTPQEQNGYIDTEPAKPTITTPNSPPNKYQYSWARSQGSGLTFAIFRYSGYNFI